jgi:hypothetical protein
VSAAQSNSQQFSYFRRTTVMNSTIILCTNGVHQRCPLGAFLFSLTIQPLIALIQEARPLLLLLAFYLDDGTIVGSVADVGRALQILREEGPKYRLNLNEDKTEVF